MRLIDADKVFEDKVFSLRTGNVEGAIAKMRKFVDNAPTVDAVPVVRCKDCKFFDHSDFGKGEEYWCKHFVSTYDDNTYCHIVMEDDFCSWAERKDDE